MTTPLQQLREYASRAGLDPAEAIALAISAADEALGRWRPEPRSQWVIYRSRDIGPNAITVLNESTGAAARFHTEVHAAQGDSEAATIARAYYAAHPSSPWLDAEVGDLWALTIDGGERDYLAVTNDHGDIEFVAKGTRTHHSNRGITAGELVHRSGPGRRAA